MTSKRWSHKRLFFGQSNDAAERNPGSSIPTAHGLVRPTHSTLASLQDQFVTVGDDGTVRVWSNGEKKVAKAFNIG